MSHAIFSKWLKIRNLISENYWRPVVYYTHARIQKILSEGVRSNSDIAFFCWWGERRSKYHYKRAIIGSPAKCHFNEAIIVPPGKRYFDGVLLMGCILLVGWWWPNIECWLGSFMIFQGIWTSIAKKPYSFVIFQGGGGGGPTPCPPFWIRTMYYITWQTNLYMASEHR